MAQDDNSRRISASSRGTGAAESNPAIESRKLAARAVFAAIAISIFCVVPEAAGAAGPVSADCDREKLPGRSYVECLEAALRDSDRALSEASQRAQARVEARTDLAITQRTRWKNVLEESQGQFIRFRNFDCQNVAPYEGTSGRIGAFNERLACLIEKNMARTQELLRRYGNE
jgi:uncharacterized protein YecT (DUF1311 family)